MMRFRWHYRRSPWVAAAEEEVLLLVVRLLYLHLFLYLY